MLPYRDSRITKIALVIFFVLLIGYAYFEARGLIFGPSISVASGPIAVSDPLVTISGHADRISSLSMNGKAVPVTEDGDFSEPYLLSRGDNVITLEARDKYGRKRTQRVEIVYTPRQEDPGVTAMETQASSSTVPLAPIQ